MQVLIRIKSMPGGLLLKRQHNEIQGRIAGALTGTDEEIWCRREGRRGLNTQGWGDNETSVGLISLKRYSHRWDNTGRTTLHSKIGYR